MVSVHVIFTELMSIFNSVKCSFVLNLLKKLARILYFSCFGDFRNSIKTLPRLSLLQETALHQRTSGRAAQILQLEKESSKASLTRVKIFFGKIDWVKLTTFKINFKYVFAFFKFNVCRKIWDKLVLDRRKNKFLVILLTLELEF